MKIGVSVTYKKPFGNQALNLQFADEPEYFIGYDFI
jgi:hypothetical protein